MPQLEIVPLYADLFSTTFESLTKQFHEKLNKQQNIVKCNRRPQYSLHNCILGVHTKMGKQIFT